MEPSSHMQRGLRSAAQRIILTGIMLAVIGMPFIAGAQIKNPIGCDDIGACIIRVVNYVLGLAGVLALAAIVYGGFLYITAAGNQDLSLIHI